MDKHDVSAYLAHVGATLPAVGHGWRKMKCPFHGDKHASAAINYDDNRFKCFDRMETASDPAYISRRKENDKHN